MEKAEYASTANACFWSGKLRPYGILFLLEQSGRVDGIDAYRPGRWEASGALRRQLAKLAGSGGLPPASGGSHIAHEPQ